MKELLVKLIRRGLIPVAGIALAAVALSGCGGPMASSSAAIVGEQAVANTSLDTFVADLHRARNQPVDQADLTTTQNALNRLVLENLVQQAAVKLGVAATDAEVQQRIDKAAASLGGREALDKALLDSDIPPSGAEDAFRLAANLEKMGPVLVPGTDKNAQDQAVYEYVYKLAGEIGITANPRYGTWNAKDLRLGPLPTDLAGPASEAPNPIPSSAPAQ